MTKSVWFSWLLSGQDLRLVCADETRRLWHQQWNSASDQLQKSKVPCQCFHLHFKQGIFIVIITILITSSQDKPSNRVEGFKAAVCEKIVILLFVFYCTINMPCVYPVHYMTEAFESMGECVQHLYWGCCILFCMCPRCEEKEFYSPFKWFWCYSVLT